MNVVESWWCQESGVTFSIQEAVNTPVPGQQARFESIFLQNLKPASTGRHFAPYFSSSRLSGAGGPDWPGLQLGQK